MKTKTMYMHTIRGRPAFYEEGKMIYYANHGLLVIPDGLVSSLKQIRKEQAASKRYRKKKLGLDEERSDYGYIRVKVVEQ